MQRPASFRIPHCSNPNCLTCAMERPLSRTERASLAAIVLLAGALIVAFGRFAGWVLR